MPDQAQYSPFPAPINWPATLLVAAAGLGLLWFFGRRRRRK